jgi:hypothetical protein
MKAANKNRREGARISGELKDKTSNDVAGGRREETGGIAFVGKTKKRKRKCEKRRLYIAAKRQSEGQPACSTAMTYLE